MRVGHDLHTVDFTVLGEEFSQFGLIDPRSDASDEQIGARVLRGFRSVA